MNTSSKRSESRAGEFAGIIILIDPFSNLAGNKASNPTCHSVHLCQIRQDAENSANLVIGVCPLIKTGSISYI